MPVSIITSSVRQGYGQNEGRTAVTESESSDSDEANPTSPSMKEVELQTRKLDEEFKHIKSKHDYDQFVHNCNINRFT